MMMFSQANRVEWEKSERKGREREETFLSSPSISYLLILSWFSHLLFVKKEVMERFVSLLHDSWVSSKLKTNFCLTRTFVFSTCDSAYSFNSVWKLLGFYLTLKWHSEKIACVSPAATWLARNKDFTYTRKDGKTFWEVEGETEEKEDTLGWRPG